MTEPTTSTEERWLTPGVRGIGTASFLADVGHEIPTALLPNLLTVTLGAPAAALGLIEGVSDGLAGVARLAGGAIADDPQRRRAQAVAGYTTTAVLSSLIGAATAVWQVAVLRAGAWAARGLRVPARNALLADIVPASVYGRAYGFERAMDNLGAIVGPLLALALVGLVGTRTAIALSIIPGLLAALAIVYAIRHAPRAEQRERQPLRLRIRPVLTGRLGRLMVGVSAFEFGNVAATLLILRATELLAPGRDQDRATQLALALYVAYNLAATVASVPAGRLGDRRGARLRPGPGRGPVRAGLCRLCRRRHQRPRLGALVPRCRGGHRLCGDRRACRRGGPGPGGAARISVRAAGGGAELRKPGRQRHRRPALDAGLAPGGLRLPGRLDGPRFCWAAGGAAEFDLTTALIHGRRVSSARRRANVSAHRHICGR
jgi:MFS family permease